MTPSGQARPQGTLRKRRAEVVLSAGESVAEGVTTARRVMEQLGIDETDLVARAHIDLLKGEA